MLLRAADFESAVSAIPPHRHEMTSRIIKGRRRLVNQDLKGRSLIAQLPHSHPRLLSLFIAPFFRYTWRINPSLERNRMRLQKYLASCGVASRRRAEEMIAAGLVTVNGEIVVEMGTQVQDGDVVMVEGRLVQPESQKRYILYYKPIGEVTTVSDPEGRPVVLDHFRDFPVRLFPVGRLDFDSEGLLILTNDGELTQRLTHPSHEVEKRYIARASNQFSDEELRALRSGIMMDGRKTAPAKVSVLRVDPFSTDLLITIHEGRNRQIRRMLETIGHDVVRLKRVQYAGVSLGDLERGQWRDLTEEELCSLS